MNGQGSGRDVGQGRSWQDHLDGRARCGAGAKGEKVVVVDFDVGLRNLDLVMGASGGSCST